jgi:hypothetical protein
MIGKKKLTTIRKQIEESYSASGSDPIQVLERQIMSAKREGGRTDVLESLKGFLESPRKRKTRKRKPGAISR